MKTKNNKNKKHGLILLVVLGMLTLFSLLTVTFVLVSSQSRSTNIAFSRRMVRETETRPLLNDAVHQLLRGTTDQKSAMYGQDLLGDLYGANEAGILSSQVISIRRNITWAHDNLQRPMLLGGNQTFGARRFLKIPFELTGLTPELSALLSESDALSGRVITFPEGQGPLAGESFRVIRHVGNMTGDSNPIIRDSSFSITIDLNDANLGREYTRTIPGSGVTETKTIAEWAEKYPSAPNTFGWASGIYLCYNRIDTSDTRALADPFQFYVNAMPLNGHGIGVASDGSTQIHTLFTGSPPGNHTLSPEINQMAVAFQPQLRLPLTATSSLNIDPSRFIGDTDEPIDAADYNSFFLSHRDAESGEIIPSFHRAELINYIVNFKRPADYSEWDFWATIRRIQLATSRPLSLHITTPSGSPPFMDATPGSKPYSLNPQFNTGDIGTLTINVGGSADQWDSNWPTQGLPAFIEWLNRLTGRSQQIGGGTRMTWDVDNLGTGMPDSIWMDLGLPLQRTADGKLLKSLVAYYVEDLDGKLDINASGSVAQANVQNLGYYARPTHRPPTPPTTQSPFALGPGTPAQSLYLNQGLGYGPADISFRHLLGRAKLEFRYSDGTRGVGQTPAEQQFFAERAYREIMVARYQPNPSYSTYRPGSELGHDAISQLNLRETRIVHRHGSLPGLPMGVRGRVSLTLDRLGNPILHNYDNVITSELTEYASRLISTPHQDSPFTIAEWERIYRVADADRSDLPDRLQRLFGETEQTLPTSSLRREITPVSRNMRVPLLGGRTSLSFANKPGNSFAHNPQSFLQLINSVRGLRDANASHITPNVYAQLFPLEFRHGLAMNLNRPFGNGLDDSPPNTPGFGEIDEPAEIAGGNESAWDASGVASIARTSIGLDYLQGSNPNDMKIEPDYLFNEVKLAGVNVIQDAIHRGEHSRQLFARHLYCLAQLLVPEEYAFPNIELEYWQDILKKRQANDTKAKSKYIEIRGRILAQWAVNVVDFRDSDAAMTRFPYDPDPFDTLAAGAGQGWFPYRNINGKLTGKYATSATPLELNVVWGMEQPELLLTESLAFHDLRVRKDAQADPPRFDQLRMPQGSLFLELYAPRTTGTANDNTIPGVPSGLYEDNGSGEMVLNLSRLSPPNSSGNRFPVWRIYISEPHRKVALTQNLKTPNDRLTAAAAKSITDATRLDLTYQIANSNIHHPNPSHDWGDTSWINTEAGVLSRVGGQRFDFTTENNQRLREPSPTQSRIILFTRGTDFSASSTNTPGVAAPQRQVFYNRQSTNILLSGNQYLVVGPRQTTSLGSRTSSKVSPPINEPSRQKIELTGTWAATFEDDGTASGRQFRTASQNVRPAVTMIAASDRPQGWAANPPEPTIQQIGISVSEPLPNNGYYPQPTSEVNSNDTTSYGFANLPVVDGYHDYKDGPPSAGRKPFDDGTGSGKPLRNWDQSYDADSSALTKKTLPFGNTTAPMVSPGTAIDWCTAYLQRLADPDRPWHAIFNPYLTVDWIPIDLTVFSGEDDDSALDLDTGKSLHLASRQKSGQMIEPTPDGAGVDGKGWQFDPQGLTGLTFLSSLSHAPRKAEKPGGLQTFLKYTLEGDRVPTPSQRPSKCVTSNRQFMAEHAAGSGAAFSTLGFLNSTYVLAAERTPTPHALPPVFVGAPGKPDNSSDFDWHPATVFWPNRLYVNRMELAYVPVSSPGQLGQEFTATSTTPANPLKDAFEPAYQSSNTARPTSPAVGTANDKAHYPYAHLLNFFQEAPELKDPVIVGGGPRHSKDTGPAMLLEMVETPSPWADVEGHAPPSRFAVTSFGGDWQGVADVHNYMLAPLRAPYNKLSLHAEPGKVNLNTVSSSEVLQGLVSNMLEPSDIENEVDHNSDGVTQIGSRAEPGQAATLWTELRFSRRGFEPFDTRSRTSAGYFNPYDPTLEPSAPMPLQRLDPRHRGFNPHVPTRFAGTFKAVWEVGMVPTTRNPLAVGHSNYSLAQQYGLMDLFSRQRPGYATVMRPKGPTTVALPTTDPVLDESNLQPLFPGSRTYTQRHPHNDLYPISRLQNLVTERSNVFAVYATVGLFEYDESSNSIGAEFGRETGQNKRLKSFYVIDRSIPVLYRPGEDTNVDKLILIKRILSE